MSIQIRNRRGHSGGALASVLANRPFRIFLGAHVLFASAASLIFPVLPYLATVLLGRSEGFAFDLSASLGLMIAVGYAIVPRLLGSLRPKKILLISFFIFGAAAAALGMIEPSGPGQPPDVRPERGGEVRAANADRRCEGLRPPPRLSGHPDRGLLEVEARFDSRNDLEEKSDQAGQSETAVPLF